MHSIAPIWTDSSQGQRKDCKDIQESHRPEITYTYQPGKEERLNYPHRNQIC